MHFGRLHIGQNFHTDDRHVFHSRVAQLRQNRHTDDTADRFGRFQEASRHRLQRSRYFLDPVGVKYVAFFDVVKAGQLDAAFHAARHFAHVILLAAERVDRIVADGPAITIDADAAAAFDGAADDLAASDGAHATDRENLLDQGGAHILDALFRLELAFEQGFDVVSQLVNDVVTADFDAPLVGQGAGGFVGYDIEANDHGVGGTGQRHVRDGDAADGSLQHLDFD